MGGIGLFVALLGWGNRFKQPKEEIRKIEEKVIKKMKLKMSDIVRFKRTSVMKKKSLSQTYLLDEIKAMAKLLVKKIVKNKLDIEIIKKFKKIASLTEELYNWYNYRYTLVVILTLVLFITGVICFFDEYIIIDIIDLETLCFFFPIILILAIILFSIKIHLLESDFRENSKKLIEDIEVK